MGSAGLPSLRLPEQARMHVRPDGQDACVTFTRPSNGIRENPCDPWLKHLSELGFVDNLYAWFSACENVIGFLARAASDELRFPNTSEKRFTQSATGEVRFEG